MNGLCVIGRFMKESPVVAEPAPAAKDGMICHEYGSRTNYLLFCNSLNKAENAYNLALLPKMQGERDDLLYVIEKMHTCVTNLRRKEADRVFP